jgi:hypothetical protein
LESSHDLSDFIEACSDRWSANQELLLSEGCFAFSSNFLMGSRKGFEAGEHYDSLNMLILFLASRSGVSLYADKPSSSWSVQGLRNQRESGGESKVHYEDTSELDYNEVVDHTTIIKFTKYFTESQGIWEIKQSPESSFISTQSSSVLVRTEESDATEEKIR